MKKITLIPFALSFIALMILTGCPTDPDEDNSTPTTITVTGLTSTSGSAKVYVVPKKSPDPSWRTAASGTGIISNGQVTVSLKKTSEEGKDWTNTGLYTIELEINDGGIHTRYYSEGIELGTFEIYSTGISIGTITSRLPLFNFQSGVNTVDYSLFKRTTTKANVPSYPITITTAGNATEIKQGNTLQFSAGSNSVTWSIAETGKKAGTTISSSGLLKAASDESLDRIVVKAVSTTDPAQLGAKAVLISATFEGTWTASNGRAITFTGNNFNYKVNGTTQYSGTFSVSGSTMVFNESKMGTASGGFQLSGGTLTLSNHTWDSSVNGIYTRG